VAAVITLADPAAPHNDTSATPSQKKGKKEGSGRITVTKDGNVYADDRAMSALETVETPEPSHACYWWAGALLTLLLVLAWAVRQFSWVAALISRLKGIKP
jgi:hypothetical protein